MPKRDIEKKWCRCCDREFYATRSDKQTCSAKCRQRVSRAVRAGVQFAWGRLLQPALFKAGPHAGVQLVEGKKGGKKR